MGQSLLAMKIEKNIINLEKRVFEEEVQEEVEVW